MIWTQPRIWEKSNNINIADWQRIEDNTRWIAEFYGVTLQYKTWQHTSWPTPAEVARIQNNINSLLEHTFSFQSKFDWNLLNEIEGMLLHLREKVVQLQLSIRRAGTFCAGQQNYIPLGVN